VAVIVDTDILIDYLQGLTPVVRQVKDLATEGRLKTTAISLFELLSGATDGRRGDAARSLAEIVDVLPLDRKSAIAAARIRRELDASGQAIGMGDSLIAGICLAHDLPLLTRNKRHFARVRDLVLVEIYPSG